MADQMLAEIAPLLAEEGIDLNDPDNPPDRATLQAAMERSSPWPASIEPSAHWTR